MIPGRNTRLLVILFYITHVDGGADTLNFTVPVDTEIYTHISEENRVEYEQNYYLVKTIDAPGTTANIGCSIDLDFLRERFLRVYDSGSLTATELMQSILPTGWTISGDAPATRRTLHMENATDYDIANQVRSVYGVAFIWHTVTKQLVIVTPDNITASGEYLTDELNLRSIAFKGKTTEFITRLYAYGNEGLTFADINGGKEYVENFQYSTKIVSGYWSDDRYTVAENLLTDAKEMLRGLSAPQRSYECDVIDLAKLDVKYSAFTFSMYKVVTLIDRQRNVRMNHQIREYKEYPDEPQKNVLTLSSVVKSLSKQINSAISEVQETINDQRNLGQINMQLIANSLGFYETSEIDAEGRRIAYLHNKPLLSESTVIWKYTVQGFTWSTDGGATWNGGINADGNATLKTLSALGINADWIKTGVIKSLNGKSEINMDTGEANLYGKLTTQNDSNGYSIECAPGGIQIFRNGVLAGSFKGYITSEGQYHTRVITNWIRPESDAGLYIATVNQIVGWDTGMLIQNLRRVIGIDTGILFESVGSIAGISSGMTLSNVAKIFARQASGSYVGGDVGWRYVKATDGSDILALCYTG